MLIDLMEQDRFSSRLFSEEEQEVNSFAYWLDARSHQCECCEVK